MLKYGDCIPYWEEAEAIPAQPGCYPEGNGAKHRDFPPHHPKAGIGEGQQYYLIQPAHYHAVPGNHRECGFSGS